MHRFYLSLVAFACLLGACNSGDYSITLRNDTDQPWIPYPVVVNPGSPPQRVADPANTLAPTGKLAIDPTGFNPLFFVAGPLISITLQLGLDSDPAIILVRTSKHVVEPGQEGVDPALQPTLLKEKIFEPTALNLLFSIKPGDDAGFTVDFAEK